MHESDFTTLEDAKDPGWPWATVKFRREMSFHALQFTPHYETGKFLGALWVY